MRLQKTKIYRNKKYLNFIRKHPCIIDVLPAEAHHVTIDHNAKGIGIKTHDYDTIPLSRARHDEHDRLGQESFFKKYDINPLREIVGFLGLYVSHKKPWRLNKMTEEQLLNERERLINYIELRR